MRVTAIGWRLLLPAAIAFILAWSGPTANGGVEPREAVTGLQPAIAGTAACPPGMDTPNLFWYNANFGVGPAIPSTNKDFVPQGLGYWASKDWLITSLSESDTFPNRIAITNRSTGVFVKFLLVESTAGTILGGHMGGLSVSASNLWISTNVGSNHLVYRIPLSAVASTASSGSVRANKLWNVGASSYNTYYATGAGNYLYFGIFNPALTGTDTMYRYLLSASEDLVAASRTPIITPTQVQGAAVANGYYIFSTSYGRNCYSRLQFKNISSNSPGRSIQIPPMSEGIVRVPRGAAGWADDWLYVNFESGSNKYPDATLRTFKFSHALITALTP